MLGCCLGRHRIHDINDENITEKPSSNRELRFKIQKQLIKTRKNNHIGYGISSNVFKIKLNDNFISCKVIKKGWEKETENELHVLKEIKKINSDLLPSFVCNFKLNLDEQVICYNYISGSDLQNLISENNIFKYNEKKIIRFLYQVCLGLKSLVDINYVHLDLKPENIMVSSMNPIKITLIDLSFCSNFKKNQKEKLQGTMGYISPEMIVYKSIYHNTDIWSLGIICYLLYTSKFIFGVEDEIYINNIKAPENINKTVDFVMSELSLEIENIVSKCLVYNTHYRISVNGIISLIESIRESSIS